MPKRIVFHGTDADAAQSILREGFRDWTYFARALEDAVEFGGDHIFEVCVDLPDSDNWQPRLSGVKPDQVVRLYRFDRTDLFRDDARRKAFFAETPN